MSDFFHSVTLDKNLCKGCTNCIKLCPTQAIRVRGGKAKIIKERCIDCGECIRVCPYHAKKAITDPLDVINQFKYKIALPAPALYGQFDKDYSVDTILTGLLELGFDDVFEAAQAAEVVSDASKFLFSTGELLKPVISSACPVILRLITVKFPELIGNVMPVQAPIDVAARMAKKLSSEKTGLSEDEIGVFFISPCPAKATTLKAPLGIKKSDIDGVIAMKDICLKLAHIISGIKEPKKLSKAGMKGIGWAKSEGESEALGIKNHIAADGINNCIKLLGAIEDDRLENIDFVEMSGCLGGCVGGVLTVENPYIAKNRINRVTQNMSDGLEKIDINTQEVLWTTPVIYRPVMNLDTNIIMAMRKMEMMESIYNSLPQIDCGACGSPTCRTLAEDIVRGFAVETDCIFKLREKVHNLAMEMMNLESKMPSSMKKKDT